MGHRIFLTALEGYLQTCLRIEATQNNNSSAKGKTYLKNLNPLIKQVEQKLSDYNRPNSQKEFSKWHWMAFYINNWLNDGATEDLRKFKREMVEKEGIIKINI